MREIAMTEEQQEIANSYMNLAEIYANKYHRKTYYDDLVQELRYAICYSVATWQDGKGATLPSYIITYIKITLGRFLYKWFNCNSQGMSYTASYDEILEQQHKEPLGDMTSISRSLEDEYVTKHFLDDWIHAMLDRIYKERKTSQSVRKVYDTFLQIASKQELKGVQSRTAEVCHISRERVRVIVKEYNKYLQQEWNKEK